MPEVKDLVAHLDIAREYRQPLEDLVIKWKLKTYVDILVVVDTEIATEPGVGFGIGSVIELIRGAAVGCMRFRVDIALRNGESPTVVAAPAAFAPKYRGFRFDMLDGGVPVLDTYEQVWCFGFKPSNSGSIDDAEIELATSFPASDAELAKLARWMDERQGGLFGTGDHHFLGASMCRRIPRLGRMRRWTNADGVPPIGTPDRIDTLRPPSPAYEPGAPGGPQALGNGPHQGDDTPQPIQWVAWQRSFWPIFWRKRPHPLLCHPTLGPIDVMPDHAHEGLCLEAADIDAGASYDFDGSGAKPEFPDATVGGSKPLPGIIAYGSTLGDPPYNFAKGEQPARGRFPMISAYDGHQAGVGRVATDSTWHHWFDINLVTFKAANNDIWKKISRYYINLAVWLNPPGISTSCLYLSSVASHFQYAGFQEYWVKRPTLELGDALRQQLIKTYGPCWVTERIVFDLIWVRRLWPWEILREREPLLPFGGIDPEIIENAYLGALVEATMEQADRIKTAVQDGKQVAFSAGDPEKLFARPLKAGLSRISKQLLEHAEANLKFARLLNGRG